MLVQDVIAHTDLTRLVTDPKLLIIEPLVVSLALTADLGSRHVAPHAPPLDPVCRVRCLALLGWSGRDQMQARIQANRWCLRLGTWSLRLALPETATVPVIIDEVHGKIFPELA